jgi:K+-sensing histidine kinase KdpD
MRMLTRVAPVAASLAVIGLVTAILWYLQRAGAAPLHPVFFYLLPVALLTIFCGRLPAMLGAFLAMACSAYFLYDPVYSFEVTNRLEIGDLVCFGVLALIGVHCTDALLRPPSKATAAQARYGKP